MLSENATADDLCGPVVVDYENEYSLTDALGNFIVTRIYRDRRRWQFQHGGSGCDRGGHHRSCVDHPCGLHRGVL